MSSQSKSTPSGERITIPLLPLRDILVFPSTVVPLFVGREKSIQALEAAMAQNKEILLAAQKKAKTNDPQSDEIYEVGATSTILQMLRLPDGTVKVLVEGKKRARIHQFVQTDEYFVVDAEVLVEETPDSLENEALLRTVKMAFDNYVRLNKRIPPEMLLSLAQIESETKLADTLVAHLSTLKLKDKQALLEETNPKKRLETLYGFIQSEIEIMRVEKKIKARVKRQMEKTQKEYYLNEQMAAIQKELGDKDEARAELQEMEKAVKQKKLSKEAKDRIQKEIRKLRMMSSVSAEATVVRNYIETVLSLPWKEHTKDCKDVSYAEEVLERDHFGLEKIKERILEYLAIKSITDSVKGPILCLVGPPGVGKTSLAKSIADAMHKKFVRVYLGGVKDQAEIRGHRKTYVGSMPGKIVMALRKANSANPLMLLDEIDKLSNDYRGDPAAALLEVLDPEQNHSFNDHYLDLDFDVSKVLFIATANSMEGIPLPLIDRMEIIRIAGYTEIEKAQIAQKFLIPKQLSENGLTDCDIQIQPKAVTEVIRYYTKEAGVRNLEREFGSLLRKVAKKHLSKKSNKPKDDDSAKPTFKEIVSPKTVEKILGPKKYRIGQQNECPEIGMCTGLAWTSVGGELLTSEVAVLPGKGKLLITGKLGDVMQESAQAALSYVRSRADFLGLDENFYQKIDIHIHVPEGAIPKDGPSAGICMATALTSALTQRAVSQDVAMTGEITLRGRCLAIGGLKEKSLAAHRAGIKKILFPKENEKDLADIPKNVQKDVEFVPVEHMDEVLIHAIEWSHSSKSTEDDLLGRLRKIVAKTKPTADPSVTH